MKVSVTLSKSKNETEDATDIFFPVPLSYDTTG